MAEKAVRLDTGVARYHRQLAEVQGVMAQRAGMLQQFMLARRFRSEIDAVLRLDPRDTQALRDLLEFYLLAPGVVGGDAKKAAPVAERIGDRCGGRIPGESANRGVPQGSRADGGDAAACGGGSSGKVQS